MKKHTRIIFAFLSIASLALSGAITPSQASAPHGEGPLGISALLYVDDDGVCAGNQPCYTTIAAGMAATNPGDTLYIYAGTYAEDLIISTNVTVELAGDIIIQNFTQSAGVFNSVFYLLDVQGDFTCSNGGFNPGAGMVRFTGASSLVSTTSPFSFIVLNMSGPGLVTLNSNIYVQAGIVMGYGFLALGSNHLVMAPDAQFYAGGPYSFVTSGTGEVRKEVISADPASFFVPTGDLVGAWDFTPVTLDLSGVSGTGFVSIRLSPTAEPHNLTEPRLNRQWVLGASGLTAFTWDGVFTYVDADVLGAESLLFAARYTDKPVPTWIVSGPADTVNNTLSFTGQTGFSNITGTPQEPDAPTAVEMADMLASSGLGAVSLSWQTATEAHTSGFLVYRSSSSDVQRSLLSDLIPAEGGLEGATYSYTDFSATPGATYYYWIEAISDDGIQTYGPLVATVKPPLYLPLIR